MWMYLFLLPFQIYNAYKWLTIPGTAFAAFLLLGFLEIGREVRVLPPPAPNSAADRTLSRFTDRGSLWVRSPILWVLRF